MVPYMEQHAVHKPTLQDSMRTNRGTEQKNRFVMEHPFSSIGTSALKVVTQPERRRYASASESPQRQARAAAALTEWLHAAPAVLAAAARYTNSEGRKTRALHVATSCEDLSWGELQTAALLCATG